MISLFHHSAHWRTNQTHLPYKKSALQCRSCMPEFHLCVMLLKASGRSQTVMRVKPSENLLKRIYPRIPSMHLHFFGKNVCFFVMLPVFCGVSISSLATESRRWTLPITAGRCLFYFSPLFFSRFSRCCCPFIYRKIVFYLCSVMCDMCKPCQIVILLLIVKCAMLFCDVRTAISNSYS